MDSITYRGMNFPVLSSSGWEREAMLDPSNMTYECTRVRASVIVSYNPAAASFVPNRNSGSVTVSGVTAQVGQMPDETDLAIRRFLEQPRGLLTVTSGGRTWLTSPESDGNVVRKCDVRNGPFLKVNNVQQTQGERLWKIHLEIETYIVENTFGGTTPMIISNRWYAIDDTNWQHLRTRVYQGICTVRADLMWNEAGTDRFVDSLRSTFAAFTVPDGFQRDNVKVSVTPDGLSAHYTVTDSEKLFNTSLNCPAVRIEVADTSWIWRGSAPLAVAQAGGWRTFTNVFGAPQRWLGISTQAQTDEIAVGIAGTAGGNLPKFYKNAVVTAWGNQDTSRVVLVNYALAVALTRTGQANLSTGAVSSETIISQDTNNRVHVSHTIRWGADVLVNTFGALLGQAFAGNALFNANGVAAQGEELFNLTIRGTPDTNPPGFGNPITQQLARNPPFPSSRGTRGTAVGANQMQVLLTQVLEGFDTAPAAVP